MPEGMDEPVSVITEKPQSGVFDVQGTHVRTASFTNLYLLC